jgi:imidazole glycerol-phosphate synthase subunit HisF
MIKKRIIFTLLLSKKNFILSRNFVHQKVGDINWLNKNYNFKSTSNYIDELIIINVDEKRNQNDFFEISQKIAKECFVPISYGGGIDNFKTASEMFKNGADKIIINSSSFKNPDLLNDISSVYGDQSVIVSIDFKKETEDNYSVWIENGKKKIDISIEKHVENLMNYQFGEIYLNSIDKDGTGFGYELSVMRKLKKISKKIPIIISGGAGNDEHFYEALKIKEIDAVSTAHLFNFVGDGLEKARKSLIKKEISFPEWNADIIKKINNYFK